MGTPEHLVIPPVLYVEDGELRAMTLIYTEERYIIHEHELEGADQGQRHLKSLALEPETIQGSWWRWVGRVVPLADLKNVAGLGAA